MADLRITELQLIDAVGDAENFIADDGIQTYRCTGSQISTYMIGKRYSFVNQAQSSLNSTATAATDKDTLLLSGSSFTVTLPTAVGVTGKRYTIKHNGTSLSQVYTLATTSSQTVGGYASGAVKLCTNGEVFEIESNGANWEIINHYASNNWTAFSSVAAGTLITALTSNPSYGTVVVNSAFWKRQGDSALMRWNFQQNGGSGGAGSGEYFFNFESGLVAESTKLGAVSDTTFVGKAGVGTFTIWNPGDSASTYTGTCYLYNTTKVYMVGVYANSGAGASGGVIGNGSTYGNFSRGSISYAIDLLVPIADWIG